MSFNYRGESPDIAKSNFLLKKLRLLCPTAFPFFVKWKMAGAFNGAVLSLPINANNPVEQNISPFQPDVAQVLFFSKEQSLDESESVIAKLGDMNICIDPRENKVINLSASRLQEYIEKSEMQYKETIGQMGSKNKQIARLQLSCTISGLPREEAVSKCNSFFSKFTTSAGGKPVFEPEYPEWTSPNIDHETLKIFTENTEREMEVVFSTPLSPQSLNSKIDDLIPELQGDLFGEGMILTKENSSELARSDIDSILIFARQF